MFLFRINAEIEGLGMLTSIAKFSCVWKRLVNLCNLSGLRDCIDYVKFFKNFKGKTQPNSQFTISVSASDIVARYGDLASSIFLQKFFFKVFSA